MRFPLVLVWPPEPQRTLGPQVWRRRGQRQTVAVPTPAPSSVAAALADLNRPPALEAVYGIVRGWREDPRVSGGSASRSARPSIVTTEMIDVKWHTRPAGPAERRRYGCGSPGVNARNMLRISSASATVGVITSRALLK